MVKCNKCNFRNNVKIIIYFASMRSERNSLYLLYIFSFIYLVMCPSAQQLCDIVRYDVIIEIGDQLSQHTIKKNSSTSTCNFPNGIKTSEFDQSRSCIVKHTKSPLPALSLSVLSTVKLIL